MRRRVAGGLAGLLAVVAVGVAVGCSPLKTFDTLMPKDGGVRVTRDIGYGPAARQRLDVYRPAGAAAAAKLPVIVFFYGGSWATGTKAGYDFAGRALASRGFVTVIPDYRLVPQVVYPAFVQDGAAAVGWVRRHAAEVGGDPGRIVLAGHSAGAYIAAMLAVDPRWLGRDRAAVRGLIGLAGPYDFAPFDVDASRNAFGRWPNPQDTQPVAHAGAGDPPALLLTGDDDTTVRPRNSEALAAKLHAGGVAVVLKHYPRHRPCRAGHQPRPPVARPRADAG